MGIYKAILRQRHRAYDSGRRRVVRADVPAVCVGNVTVGGTGKTPHTEMILRLLSGYKVAVLSRGYGRRTKGFLHVDISGAPSEFGDEPLQIARKFPSVRVAVDEDRVEGCRRLAREADVIVLDDAFQYRRLKADLNIVLVNYNRPVFSDKMLPLGMLRDLPERIFEADVIIVTKCPDWMWEENRRSFAESLHLADYDPEECRAYTPSGRKIRLFFSGVRYLDPVAVFPEGESGVVSADSTVVISAIAGNHALSDHLASGRKVEELLSFPDHHSFTAGDVARINDAASRFPSAVLFTTEKDAQRLLPLSGLSADVRRRLFYVPIEAEFLSGHEKELFAGLLEDLVKGGVQTDDVL